MPGHVFNHQGFPWRLSARPWPLLGITLAFALAETFIPSRWCHWRRTSLTSKIDFMVKKGSIPTFNRGLHIDQKTAIYTWSLPVKSFQRIIDSNNKKRLKYTTFAMPRNGLLMWTILAKFILGSLAAYLVCLCLQRI